MSQLTPFGHIPQFPVEDVNLVKISIVTGVAILLTLIGFLGYNIRDLSS